MMTSYLPRAPLRFAIIIIIRLYSSILLRLLLSGLISGLIILIIVMLIFDKRMTLRLDGVCRDAHAEGDDSVEARPVAEPVAAKADWVPVAVVVARVHAHGVVQLLVQRDERARAALDMTAAWMATAAAYQRRCASTLGTAKRARFCRNSVQSSRLACVS